MISAKGVRLFFFIKSSPATINTQAPSLIDDEFPAVTLPFLVNAGRNVANFSKVQSVRGPSSLETFCVDFFSSIVSGTICDSKTAFS